MEGAVVQYVCTKHHVKRTARRVAVFAPDILRRPHAGAGEEREAGELALDAGRGPQYHLRQIRGHHVRAQGGGRDQRRQRGHATAQLEDPQRSRCRRRRRRLRRRHRRARGLLRQIPCQDDTGLPEKSALGQVRVLLNDELHLALRQRQAHPALRLPSPGLEEGQHRGPKLALALDLALQVALGNHQLAQPPQIGLRGPPNCPRPLGLQRPARGRLLHTDGPLRAAAGAEFGLPRDSAAAAEARKWRILGADGVLLPPLLLLQLSRRPQLGHLK
mmetsp:Transcript_43857/g.125446  ORF Transcript_43857/g.125446 Transcript_43857/m.125446 type:complete len:274 (-) Transcript_43857:124-945(-)